MSEPEHEPSVGGRPRRSDWQEAFLENFSTHGVQAWACRSVNVSPDTVKRERERDADFAARFDEAFETSTAVQERRLVQWATAGIPTEKTIETTITKVIPKLTTDAQGNPVTVNMTTTTTTTTTTRGVDLDVAALIFLLKSRRPEVYRERVSVEQSGVDGGPIRYEMTEKEVRAADQEISRLMDELAPRREAKATRGA